MDAQTALLNLLHDTTAITYLAIVGVCTVGFCLFFWVYVQAHRAEIDPDRKRLYLYVTNLIGGEAIANGLGVYARYLRFKDMYEYYDFMSGPVWIMRTWIILVCLTLIVLHMAYRVLTKGKHMLVFALPCLLM